MQKKHINVIIKQQKITGSQNTFKDHTGSKKHCHISCIFNICVSSFRVLHYHEKQTKKKLDRRFNLQSTSYQCCQCCHRWIANNIKQWEGGIKSISPVWTSVHSRKVCDMSLSQLGLPGCSENQTSGVIYGQSSEFACDSDVLDLTKTKISKTNGRTRKVWQQSLCFFFLYHLLYDSINLASTGSQATES